MGKFENKTLLFLDGSALAIPAIKRAKKFGIRTIVANYYSADKAPAKLVADEAVEINFMDIDKMVSMMKEKHVDGIFQGWTDSHLSIYAELCEKMNFYCYGTKQQFEICIDKDRFKKICIQHDVPTIYEYVTVIKEGKLCLEKMEKIQYPVLVKPVDNSGSRGIYVCKNEEELKENFEKALNFSPSKNVLIEQYVTGQHVNMYYTLSGGKIYLSAMADRYVDYLDGKSAPVPVLLIHPSKYLSDYEENVDKKVKKLFQSMGMKNGIAFVQGFRCEDGTFLIYEMGYRPNGGGTYELINECSGYHQIDMLINFALTGEMGFDNVLKKQTPHFSRMAVTFVLSTGTESIFQIEGLKELEGVINVISVRFPEEKSCGEGSHSRIVGYILFTVKNKDELESKLKEFYKNITIKNDCGEKMYLARFDLSTIEKRENKWIKI